MLMTLFNFQFFGYNFWKVGPSQNLTSKRFIATGSKCGSKSSKAGRASKHSVWWKERVDVLRNSSNTLVIMVDTEGALYDETGSDTIIE